MKKWAILGTLLCLLAVFLLPEPIPGWQTPEGLRLSQSWQVQKELRFVLPLSGDRNGIETALIHEGFAVEDTDPIYPGYLANSEGLRAFAAGERDACTVFHVGEDGRVFHLFFTRDQLFLTTLENGQVTEQERLPLYEAELSEWDTFYYRCYPAGDPHYIDYSYFRLAKPNRALYDLTQTYVLPVGYQMVNLFLCDWQEGDWGDLCLNDTFEYLYALAYGQEFPWQTYTPRQDTGWYAIEAALFEGTILPYFAITQQKLRTLCRYDAETDTYPWRPAEGNTMTVWDHPPRQPEVTQAVENSDGTLTLTVQVGSPDQKTNALFTHELTVRPTDAGFQYVSNRITYISEQGLPPALARFALG